MRNTMIAQLSDADLDIFFVLSSEYYKADGQQHILDKVPEQLRPTLPESPHKRLPLYNTQLICKGMLLQ